MKLVTLPVRHANLRHAQTLLASAHEFTKLSEMKPKSILRMRRKGRQAAEQ